MEPDEPEPVTNERVLGPHNLVALGTAVTLAGAVFAAYLWVTGLFNEMTRRGECLERRVEALERECWRIDDHRRFTTYLRKHEPGLSDSLPWTDDILSQRTNGRVK